jgi:peptidoglycan/LPS O-acetylase OafA/YrhL
VLIVVIIIALAITFYKNLAYNYEMQGNIIDIMQYFGDATGYDMTQSADGGVSFCVEKDDPQIIFNLIDFNEINTMGGVEIEYATDENANVQVFYAQSGEEYTEKHSTKSQLKTGENTVLIPMALGQYGSLRIDIDGDFTLYGVKVCSGKMKATPYISGETVNKCLWYFPAIIIGFSLIFWAHNDRYRKGSFTPKTYVEDVLLGAKPSEGREIYLDYMRVLAAVLVILAHTCSPMVDVADAPWKRLVLVMGLSLGLCCNLIYVMLSGTLLLTPKGKKRWNKEGVMEFYIKRASKVIIPLIAYYLLLLSLNNEVGFLPPRNIGIAFKRIITGAPDVAPHLWLIYTIVALYFVTPFFRAMVYRMNVKLMFSLAAVIMVLNILTTYLPIFGMTFGATSFLAGWEGVFLLGYILTRQNKLPNAPKRNKYMIIAAVISYIITVLVVFNDSSMMNYVYNCAPTLVVISCGIFALFLNNKSKFDGKSNWIVRMCSKYSYSIILIHWYALFVVVSGKMHITALRFGCIGGIIATVVATFVTCIVMAVVFDNTVVIVLNKLFNMLFSAIQRKPEK